MSPELINQTNKHFALNTIENVARTRQHFDSSVIYCVCFSQPTGLPNFDDGGGTAAPFVRIVCEYCNVCRISPKKFKSTKPFG